MGLRLKFIGTGLFPTRGIKRVEEGPIRGNFSGGLLNWGTGIGSSGFQKIQVGMGIPLLTPLVVILSPVVHLTNKFLWRVIIGLLYKV